MQKIVKQYPFFAPEFFNKIVLQSTYNNQKELIAFYRAYLPIFKAAQKINAPQKTHPQLEQAFGVFHAHFPKYPLPKQIIYFIGPMESYANILTQNAVAIGLQMHLGAQAEWYYSEQIQTIYPPYISRNFVPENILVATIQNLLEDYAPTKTVGKNLLTQMIEVGKKQYILQSILPNLSDSILWGYSVKQLNALKEQETAIWDYLIQEKLIYSLASLDTRNFMQSAASNSIFGADIPGDVGKYLGYKIVTKWMSLHKHSLQELVDKPALVLFAEAQYQP